MSDVAEKLTDCRICIQRDEPHSYEHDFVTLRNAIFGSVDRDEGSTAHDRAHAAVKTLREQVARLEAERAEIRAACDGYMLEHDELPEDDHASSTRALNKIRAIIAREVRR